MGPTPTDLLTTVLAYDDARGTPVANAPHSGYQRVEAGGTELIMDTGRPPPLAASQEAHAGCLSFELSVRLYRLVVNCGMPATSPESWRRMARSTAAHSTVTFNDESSVRFVESGAIKRMLQGMPMLGGPRKVKIDRDEQGGSIVLRAAHDGYAESFNIVHQRSVMLSPDGQRLEGEDVFTPIRGDAARMGKDAFALRFHLHPSVKATRLTDSHGAMLMLPNKEVWSFSAYEDRIDLEESVYLAGTDGPRRTLQIVIHGRARKVQRVQWSFALIAASPLSNARRARVEEPQSSL
jgi:uncharacterized heparinase superfamily protein